MFFSIYFMPDSRSYERWWRYSYFGVKTSATQHYKWPEKWRVFGLALYKNMWVGWESKVPPLCECLSAANRIQGTKRKKLGGGRQWAASYSSALGYKEEPRGQSVVPRSQLEWGGASAQHTTPATCLLSAFAAAGKDGDTSKSVFVQPLHKYPLSRLCLAEETALDWDSEMIIGGSVLLGLLL